MVSTRSQTKKVSINIYYNKTPQYKVRNVKLPQGWKWVGGGRYICENNQVDFSIDDLFIGYNNTKKEALFNILNVMCVDDDISIDIV